MWGPGLVVMLADTDAGSLITASQSGAQWGYRMVLPQLILMPVLYVVQEMTVRLGIVTKRGHGSLIRERFGRGWAWLSAFTLFASAIGALLTEFAGVAGVGELFGVSRWVSIPVATVALLALALTGSYRRVERIGLVVGAAELAFLVAMVMAQNTKNARVYTPCLDSARGCPNQCRSCGSTMAKTSISSTPAIKKAGHAIHIRRWLHIGLVSLVALPNKTPAAASEVDPGQGWLRDCGL